MNRMQQVGGGAVSQAISGALSTIHNQSPWEDLPLLLWPPALPLTGCGVYHKLLSATAPHLGCHFVTFNCGQICVSLDQSVDS